MSKLGFQAEMSRQMVAGQAMQMGVEIMQASSMELEQIVQNALLENPMLEEMNQSVSHDDFPDEWSSPSDVRDDGWSEFSSHGDVLARQNAHQFALDSITEHQTLADHLSAQIGEFSLSAQHKHLLHLLIDSLDQRGYFQEDSYLLAHEWGMDDEDTQICLDCLHQMDPSGVGAKNLQDSLLIQLETKNLGSSLAAKILREAWDDLSALKYQSMMKTFEIDEDALQKALETIRSLNPNPGSMFDTKVLRSIRPDVIVEEINGEFDVQLVEGAVPHIKFNDDYCEMMSESADKPDLRKYLKDAYQSGQSLIKAIELRQSTILGMTIALTELQADYFKYGPQHLKPLTMDIVAEKIGVHNSTISRASRDKYVKSKWGLKELRSFFSAGGIQSEGAEMSQDTIVTMLKSIIQSEDGRKPYSDAKLSEILKEKGVDIARRTVAKYREMGKILPASMRKRL